MINDAMPSGLPGMGLLQNAAIFSIGTTFSLSQIPKPAMAIITIPGSLEVAYYGALGGVASIIAKYAVEFCLKTLFQRWKEGKLPN